MIEIQNEQETNSKSKNPGIMSQQELEKKILKILQQEGKNMSRFKTKNALAKVSSILIAVSLLESIHYWMVLTYLLLHGIRFFAFYSVYSH